MSPAAPRALGAATTKVVVEPGPGVIHRGPDVVLVLPVVGPGQVEAARELLAACAVTADPTGRRRARRVAALVASAEDDALPDFLLLLDLDEGPVLLAFGDVDAVVRGRAEERVNGRSSLAWVEHRVDPDFTEVQLRGHAGPPDAGADGTREPPPGLPLDLALGTVPGSGAVVLRLLPSPGLDQGTAAPGPAAAAAAAETEPTAAPEPTAEPEPTAAPEPEAAALDSVPEPELPPVEAHDLPEPVTGPVTERVSGAAAEASAEQGSGRRDPSGAAQFTVMRPVTRFRNVALGGAVAPARAPLPLAGERPDRSEAPTVDREVIVEGLPCPVGHLNDPRSSTCVLCGRPLDRDVPPVQAARPPLGVLVTDEGSVFLLTSDVVIGREPGRAEDVIAGRAQPLQLRDEAHSVSRVHAHVRLAGWEVTVADSGSSNGTFLSRHGAAGPWLPVEHPTVLKPGDRIRLGKRHLMFDRHPAAGARPAPEPTEALDPGPGNAP